VITHPHIVFRTSESKTIFTIKPDGSVELGEGASMDEASAAFWDYVMKHRPNAIIADTAGAGLNLQTVFNELREDFSVADAGKALKAVERAIAKEK